MPTETKNRSTERVTLSVDKSGGRIQVSINVSDADGSGHGYRLFGPKYTGDSTPVGDEVLTQRDVREIMSYLRMVPQVELTFWPASPNLEDPQYHVDHWRWSVYDLGREVAKGFDPVEDVARAAAEAALVAYSEGKA